MGRPEARLPREATTPSRRRRRRRLRHRLELGARAGLRRAGLRTATRTHTCNGTGARALGALPDLLTCTDARVRSAPTLSTPLHTTIPFTTAYLPRCAQRCSRAVHVKEIDDELFDVLELPHGDRAVAHRMSRDNDGAPIVSATFTRWCRRAHEYGRTGTFRASRTRFGCAADSGSTVHDQCQVCASFWRVSRRFVLSMYFHNRFASCCLRLYISGRSYA